MEPPFIQAEGATSWGYTYYDDLEAHDHYRYLVPAVLQALGKTARDQRVFYAGCGDGVVADILSKNGYTVSGVDLSPTGIEKAKKQFPHLQLEVGSLYTDLAARYGQFPHVISLEVIEHVFYRRAMAKTIFDLTEPGGYAIISTPYHGYIKNLAIAITGKFDWHVKPLWDYGHIKFFSVNTLTELLTETGFVDIKFHHLGRIRCLAKSMLAVARKPEVKMDPTHV